MGTLCGKVVATLGKKVVGTLGNLGAKLWEPCEPWVGANMIVFKRPLILKVDVRRSKGHIKTWSCSASGSDVIKK